MEKRSSGKSFITAEPTCDLAVNGLFPFTHQDLDKQVVNSSLDDIERVATFDRNSKSRSSIDAAPGAEGGSSKAGLLPVKNAKKI